MNTGDENRPCGMRRSNKFPNSWTKGELVEKAVRELGISNNQANKKTMPELCALLFGGEYEIKFLENNPEKKESKLITLEKTCINKKTTKYPNRWSRQELIEEIIKREPQPKTAFKKTKYEELCRMLDIPVVNVPKLPPRSERKSERKSESKSERKSERKSEIKFGKRPGDCLERSLIPLKDYQLKVVNHLKKRRGVIAVHSTGSGKTLTAVAASQCFLDEYPESSVIVITPKSLQTNFIKEMASYGADIDDRYKFFTFASFMIRWNKREINCRDSMVIIDEAHNLRTRSKTGDKLGKCVRCVFNCVFSAKKVLLLTATPMYNYPYDMANLIAMIDGFKSDVRFEKLLKEPRELIKYFECKTSFYSPDEKYNKKFYPKKREHNVFLKMPESYYKKYMSLEQELSAMTPFTRDLYSLFGSSDLEKFYNGVRRGANNLETINSPKIQWVMHKIINSEPQDKFVIFSSFLEAGMELLMKRLDMAEIPYQHISGAVSKKKRTQVVQDYNENKIKVLLISKAGGEGLDLKNT